MRTHTRRRRTISETINPAIIVIEDTKHPHLPGIVRNLEVDERGGAVEAHHGAVVQP